MFTATRFLEEKWGKCRGFFFCFTIQRSFGLTFVLKGRKKKRFSLGKRGIQGESYWFDFDFEFWRKKKKRKKNWERTGNRKGNGISDVAKKSVMWKASLAKIKRKEMKHRTRLMGELHCETSSLLTSNEFYF